MTASLSGVTVLDFSTLLPGPLASLMLAEAGATVLKVERPGVGDGLRHHDPALFPMLNAGKSAVVADLADPADRDRVLVLAEGADVLVEQFRPGVMARLGLGYDDVATRNPGVVYCSITGYGQTGERARRAGHDLNYVATTGLLDLVHADGLPVMPSTVVADIAGGAYPAVINILLALAGGQGGHLDVAMADNVFPLQYWGVPGALEGRAPNPSAAALTGGSPRYCVYRTADGRAVAATPVEPAFWDRFCDAIGLPAELRRADAAPRAVRQGVADVIGSRDAAHWRTVFAAADCCADVVASVAEAAADPAFAGRGVLDGRVLDGARGTTGPAMPHPVLPSLRRGGPRTSPPLGQHDLDGLRWSDLTG